jgi:hypothetical protein
MCPAIPAARWLQATWLDRVGANGCCTMGTAAADLAVGLDEHDYLNHVGKTAATAAPITFHCRYAMLGAGDGDDTAYVFLVPDEGNGAISLLHDRLYTGALISKMRLDLEYIPHITIGRCSDRRHAKALCDSLNTQGVSIAGRIDELMENAFMVIAPTSTAASKIVPRIATSYRRRLLRRFA